MSIKIRLQSVSKGKNINFLNFEGYIPLFDNSRLYIFKFCGTDVYTNAPMNDEMIESFKQALASEFGYAPFNLSKAKRLLGNGRDYDIEQMFKTHYKLLMELPDCLHEQYNDEVEDFLNRNMINENELKADPQFKYLICEHITGKDLLI